MDTFPEFEKCCLCCPLRVGLVFCAIISLISGAMGICVLEQSTSANYENLEHVKDIRDMRQLDKNVKYLVQCALTLMCTVYLLMGLIGLFGALTDNLGAVQVFVCVSFLNLIFGFLVSLIITYECLMKPLCILSVMDWISGSLLMIGFFCYLMSWVYFISIGNSYYMNGD